MLFPWANANFFAKYYYLFSFYTHIQTHINCYLISTCNGITLIYQLIAYNSLVIIT